MSFTSFCLSEIESLSAFFTVSTSLVLGIWLDTGYYGTLNYYTGPSIFDGTTWGFVFPELDY